MEAYCQLASQFRYAVMLLEPTSPWRRNAQTLSEKTTHGVPKDKIQLMMSR